MGTSGDMAADLVEMELHGFSVGERQHQSRTDTSFRADGAKQVGVLIALVRGLTRPRASPGPLADLSVLLAQSGFVLEPDLDGGIRWKMSYVGRERSREVFLNEAITSSSCSGCCGLALMCEKPRDLRSVLIARSLYVTPKRSLMMA